MPPLHSNRFNTSNLTMQGNAASDDGDGPADNPRRVTFRNHSAIGPLGCSFNHLGWGESGTQGLGKSPDFKVFPVWGLRISLQNNPSTPGVDGHIKRRDPPISLASLFLRQVSIFINCQHARRCSIIIASKCGPDRGSCDIQGVLNVRLCCLWGHFLWLRLGLH